jgi:hypothetical protein
MASVVFVMAVSSFVQSSTSEHNMGRGTHASGIVPVSIEESSWAETRLAKALANDRADFDWKRILEINIAQREIL